MAVSAILVFSVTVSSCSKSTTSVCGRSFSVSSISSLLAHGLENVSEGQYPQLQSDLKAADFLAKETVRSEKQNSDAVRYSLKLQLVLRLMDSLSWDFSKALLDTDTSRALNDLGSVETLQQANSVESFLINLCGMPSTVPFEAVADTLPSPSIPSPTATDPSAESVDQVSEHIATGKTIAAVFGIAVSDSEAQCLGSALNGVVDATSASAGSDQYSQQFKKAFDICGIVVPVTALQK